MAHGQNFGKLPISTQILLVVTGLGVASGVIYIIHRQLEKNKLLDGQKQLAANIDFTSGGLANISKQIPPSKIPAVKEALHNFDVKVVGDMIYNAHGFWNDDEDAVFSAFARLKNRAELTLLSDYFKRLYKVDLFVYLQNFMNPGELTKINDIVKKLPTY